MRIMCGEPTSCYLTPTTTQDKNMRKGGSHLRYDSKYFLLFCRKRLPFFWLNCHALSVWESQVSRRRLQFLPIKTWYWDKKRGGGGISPCSLIPSPFLPERTQLSRRERRGGREGVCSINSSSSLSFSLPTLCYVYVYSTVHVLTQEGAPPDIFNSFVSILWKIDPKSRQYFSIL